jgi:hypothetical protein
MKVGEYFFQELFVHVMKSPCCMYVCLSVCPTSFFRLIWVTYLSVCVFPIIFMVFYVVRVISEERKRLFLPGNFCVRCEIILLYVCLSVYLSVCAPSFFRLVRSPCCLCPLSLLGNGPYLCLPPQFLIFSAVCIVSNERRRLVFPRISWRDIRILTVKHTASESDNSN